MSTLLFEANADTEDVPDMCIREPVSTHMKCGPIRRKSMVLTNPPDTQVYPMAAPDATGDLNDDTGFLQSYHLPQNVFSTAETSVTAAAISRLHPPSQTVSSCNEIFENYKVTRLLSMISGMPKLPKFQS